MTLRALLTVALVYTGSTACDEEPITPEHWSDESGIATTTSTPFHGDTSDELSLPTKVDHIQTEVCLLGEAYTCLVIVPDASHCATELSSGNSCLHRQCLVERTLVQLVLERTRCANTACPPRASDIGTVQSCAEEMRDTILACFDRSSCADQKESCPLAFSPLLRAAFLADCMRH